ncbi:hypothetical protein, partial [Halomonas sp. AOP42-A1-14]|uniref:hypothetical protein n=1 Tax=Halomonas sp. AOP42-A1-14 TaxID=3457676 RepID=UPI004033D904
SLYILNYFSLYSPVSVLKALVKLTWLSGFIDELLSCFLLYACTHVFISKTPEEARILLSAPFKFPRKNAMWFITFLIVA